MPLFSLKHTRLPGQRPPEHDQRVQWWHEWKSWRHPELDATAKGPVQIRPSVLHCRDKSKVSGRMHMSWESVRSNFLLTALSHTVTSYFYCILCWYYIIVIITVTVVLLSAFCTEIYLLCFVIQPIRDEVRYHHGDPIFYHSRLVNPQLSPLKQNGDDCICNSGDHLQFDVQHRSLAHHLKQPMFCDCRL